jgi:hypothetical protein
MLEYISPGSPIKPFIRRTPAWHFGYDFTQSASYPDTFAALLPTMTSSTSTELHDCMINNNHIEAMEADADSSKGFRRRSSVVAEVHAVRPFMVLTEV